MYTCAYVLTHHRVWFGNTNDGREKKKQVRIDAVALPSYLDERLRV